MPSTAPKRPTVLIVEDNQDVRMGYHFLLERAEFLVLEAWAVKPALEIVETNKVDLALIDLYLPGSMDGLDMIRKIHEMPSPRPAIVAMSGRPHYAHESALQTALSMGADAALTKPIPADLLVSTIRRLIGGGPVLIGQDTQKD